MLLIHVSVKERDVAHCRSLRLGVHLNLMPTLQHDGLVVRMANPAANEHLSVAPHRGPTNDVEQRRVLRTPAAVLHFGQAVGKEVTHVDRLATGSVARLRPVRLAITAPQGLVAKYQP